VGAGLGDGAATTDPAALYGPDYYASHCGDQPYARSTRSWVEFYGRISDEIVRSLAPRRVFDAGCAIGFIVEALWDRGVEAHGRDISPYAISQVRADMRPYCAEGSIADPIDGEYDLVLCIEVLEHMPEAEALRAIESITAAAPRVLFSSSPIDLNEATHINVRPTVYWLQRFAEAGFAPVPGYDASFVCPHAMLLERSESGRDEGALLTFAEIVRQRLALAERERQVVALEHRAAETEAARAEAEAARAAAEAARDAEAEARKQAEAARVTAEADLRSEMAVAVARAAETGRSRAEGALNLEVALRTVDRRRVSSLTRRWRSATRRAVKSFGSSFSPRARRARRQLIQDAKLILKSPLFDVALYAKGQRKLKGDRLDIALHYLRKGAAKGRNPSSRFDAGWYLERYPDVAAAGVNPLLHYLEHGAAEARETRAAENQQTPATMHGAATQPTLLRRFPALEPLRTFRGPHEPNWVTMITDGINAGLLFGGVGTAMVLSALIARRLGARLRLVTRTEPAHPGNFAAVLSALRVPWEGNIEFVHSPAGGGREVPLGDRDIFLTTSWWTTCCVRRAVDPRRIVYLLQEDERMFYPYGDERLRCSETLRDPDIRFVVNTEALFRHLVDGPEPLLNLRTNGVWFEPAFPATTDDRPPRPRGDKHNFLFYARPNNLRNLYWRGLEAIEACLEEGILDPEAWEIHFVGRDLEDMVLPRGVRPRLAQNLPWTEYLSLIRRMDVGLSLMDTPHPSYPPLDLAAAGAVVVTNRHGPKTSLARYSDNILCVEPTVEGLKCGIADAIRLAADGPRRRANHARNRLERDWGDAFEPVLQRLFPPDEAAAFAAD
jgi:SAM-dependent methyltransferase